MRLIQLFIFILIVLPVLVNAQTTDYQYDYNGNLIQDANKEISAIHYNFLNLADTITFSDGRKIVYTYTAAGLKIRQQVFQADGNLLQKRDYAENILYKNDTLQQVQHAEGRAVPLLPGSTFADNVYQYHIKDHLGNVRLTCTSKQDTLQYLGTMEDENAELENQWFKNLDNVVSYKAANHTPKGSKAIFLAPGNKKTPALSLAVRKGDVIIAETCAYYEKGTKDNTNKLSDVLIPAIVGSLTGGISGGEIMKSAANSSMTGLAVLALPTTEEDLPKAFLNYQLFDKNYKSIDGGFQGVTEAANFSLEKLSIKPIVIKESGYLYVYLSNSSTDEQVVYFDDFNVTYIPFPIIQEDSYYPFGMPIEEMHDQKEGEVANRNLFNGKELQDDLGLNWYDYGARMYDAALGRWHVVDPSANKYAAWSPYQYAMNDPVKLIDPDGKDIIIWYQEKGKDKSYHYKGGTPKDLPNNKFVKQVAEAWNYNVRNGGGDNLKKIAQSKSIHVNIRETTTPNLEDDIKEGSTDRGNVYKPSTHTILWDPYGASATDQGVTISPATQLEHESDHALLDAQDPKKAKELFDKKNKDYGDEEEKRVITGSEQKTALANGEIKKGGVTRKNHDGIYVKTTGPTSTKSANAKKGGGIIEVLE